MGVKNVNIKIIVAMHKPYKMPDGDMYVPLHVGKKNGYEFGLIGDDTGENISVKNPYYCELTGLYWAWKNLDCEYLGLMHYRRYFTVKSKCNILKCRSIEERLDCVLKKEEAQGLLQQYDIILPKKRNYYIETLYSHYAHTHYAIHLDLARNVISQKCPEYLESFDRVMRSRKGYMFNMFLMNKDLSDAYCEWIFEILLELEDLIPEMDLSAFQKRLYGRVGELLFNVWLDYKKRECGYKIKEVNCLFMEKIDWWRKTKKFLKAKFLHQKYEKD